MQKRFHIEGVGRFFIDYDRRRSGAGARMHLLIHDTAKGPLDITGFLPDGWRCEVVAGKGARFQCHNQDRIVYVREQDITSMYGLVATLHEIGHARDTCSRAYWESRNPASEYMRGEFMAHEFALGILDTLDMEDGVRRICYIDIEEALASHLPFAQRLIATASKSSGIEEGLLRRELLTQYVLWTNRHLRTREKRPALPWYTRFARYLASAP